MTSLQKNLKTVGYSRLLVLLLQSILKCFLWLWFLWMLNVKTVLVSWNPETVRKKQHPLYTDVSFSQASWWHEVETEWIRLNVPNSGTYIHVSYDRWWERRVMHSKGNQKLIFLRYDISWDKRRYVHGYFHWIDSIWTIVFARPCYNTKLAHFLYT